MDPVNVELSFERATTNKYLYKAADAAAGIDSLYIAKSVVGSNPPRQILVTVKEDQ